MWLNSRNVRGGILRRFHAPKSRQRPTPRRGLRLEPLETRELLTVLFVGPETRATASAVGAQETFPVSPSPIAMASTGKAVVVFSETAVGAPDSDVILQAITPSGALDPLGRIVVNTTLTGSQSFGNIGMNPAGQGEYVIVWSGQGDQPNNTDGQGVFMQRFNASNARRGGEVRVNTTVTGVQREPNVAMDQNGDYVVSWIDERTVNGVFRQNVYIRHFNSGGNPIVNAGEDNRVERVVSATDQAQSEASVAVGDDGNYLVVWSQFVGGRTRAMGRYFTPTNVTAPFFLSDNSVAGSERFPTASIDDNGDFVVTYTLVPQGVDINDLLNDTTDVYVRRFFAPVFGSAPVAKANPGGGVGPIIVPNSNFAGGAQRYSRVSIDPVTGDYTIVWDGVGPQTTRRTTTSNDPTVIEADTAATQGGVFGERFRSDGRTIGQSQVDPTGGIFRANTTTNGPQRFSGVAMRSDAASGNSAANLIVAWSGAGIGDQQGAFFQRMQRDSSAFVFALNDPNPVNFDPTTLVPILVAPNATATDANALEYNGLVLEVILSTDGIGTGALAPAAQEFLTIQNIGILPGQIGVNGNNITFGGVQIATFAFGNLPNDASKRILTITFNQPIMNAVGFRNIAVQAVMQNIVYQFTTAPTTGNIPDRLTSWTFVLVDNRTSATLTKTIAFGECDPATDPNCRPPVPIFRHRGFCDVCPLPSSRYATSLYQVLLERNGSQAEVDALANALRNGFPAASAVAGFLHSVEYRRWLIADPTNGFYNRYLGRPADEAGVQFWLNAMARGISEQQVLAGIVGSEEFFISRGNGNPAQFVNALYQSLLTRTPTAAEVNFYVARMNAGVARADIAYGFIYSNEFQTDLVREWYFHYLDDANPNPFFVSQAVARMNQRNSWRDAQTFILTSTQAIPRPLILG